MLACEDDSRLMTRRAMAAVAPSYRLPPEAECTALACTECSFCFIIPRTSLLNSTLPGANHVSCPLCRSPCHELPSAGSISGSSSDASTGKEIMPGVVEAGLLNEGAAAVKSGLVTAEGEEGFVDSVMVQAVGCAENNTESDGADGAEREERGKRAEDPSETKAEAGDMVGEGDAGKGKGKVGEMESAGKEHVVATEMDGGDGEDAGLAGAGGAGGSAVAASTGVPAAAASEGGAEGGEAEEREAASEGEAEEGEAASASVTPVAPAAPVAAVSATVPTTAPIAPPMAEPLIQSSAPAAAPAAAGEGAGAAQGRHASSQQGPPNARSAVAQHREHGANPRNDNGGGYAYQRMMMGGGSGSGPDDGLENVVVVGLSALLAAGAFFLTKKADKPPPKRRWAFF
ncbi:unnamed protein product [Closterium sp. Yama58-4]|nr:unnamed protein product [Closterium sp. Yama58-4]